MNIAKILKGREPGLKLYSPAFGELPFSYVSDTDVIKMRA